MLLPLSEFGSADPANAVSAQFLPSERRTKVRRWPVETPETIESVFESDVTRAAERQLSTDCTNPAHPRSVSLNVNVPVSLHVLLGVPSTLRSPV